MIDNICLICESEGHTYKQHSSLKLCIKCSKPRYKKYSRCEEHYSEIKFKNNNKNLQNLYKALERGLCAKCKNPKNNTTKWYCDNCNIIIKKYKQSQRANLKNCKICNVFGHNSQDHLKLNLCVSCPSQAVNKRRCRTHYLQYTRIEHEWKKKYREKRRLRGLCDCGQPLVVGRSCCRTCLDKHSLRSRIRHQQEKQNEKNRPRTNQKSFK